MKKVILIVKYKVKLIVTLASCSMFCILANGVDLSQAYDRFISIEPFYSLVVTRVVIDGNELSFQDFRAQFPSNADYGCYAQPSNGEIPRFYFMVRTRVNAPIERLSDQSFDLGYMGSSIQLDRDIFLNHAEAPPEKVVGVLSHQFTESNKLIINYSSNFDQFGIAPFWPNYLMPESSHATVQYNFQFNQDLTEIQEVQADYHIFDANEEIQHTMQILCSPPGPMS